MILATTTVEDLDRFVKIYSTAGAEKRKLHGSKGSTVFRDPNEEDRVWAHLRLGPGRLEELRLRSRGAADHAGGRAQEQAAGDGARRPVRRVVAAATREGGSHAEERCNRPPRLRGS